MGWIIMVPLIIIIKLHLMYIKLIGGKVWTAYFLLFNNFSEVYQLVNDREGMIKLSFSAFKMCVCPKESPYS